MAIRVRVQTGVHISSTSAEERDLGSVEVEAVCDTQKDGGSWKITLAAGATNVSAQLSELAECRVLHLRTRPVTATDTPGTVTVKRNGTGAEAWPVEPLPTTKQGLLMITTSGLTALYLTNPGTVAMEVTVSAVGD